MLLTLAQAPASKGPPGKVLFLFPFGKYRDNSSQRMVSRWVESAGAEDARGSWVESAGVAG